MYFIKLKKKFKIVSLMIFNSYTMWRPDVYIKCTKVENQ